MKKLLGIIASARKIGNAEIVAKAVAEKGALKFNLTLPNIEKRALSVSLLILVRIF